MNRNHAILLTIAILTLPLIWFFIPASEPGSLQSLQGVTLTNVNGDKFKLSNLFAEKPTLLVFWSTTCGSCIEEIPFIIRLHGQLKDKMSIIGVHPPFPLAKIQKFLKKNFPDQIPYLLAIDDEQRLFKAFEVTVMPKVVLLSRRGEIRYSHLGYDQSMEPDIEKAIRERL